MINKSSLVFRNSDETEEQPAEGFCLHVFMWCPSLASRRTFPGSGASPGACLQGCVFGGVSSGGVAPGVTAAGRCTWCPSLWARWWTADRPAGRWASRSSGRRCSAHSGPPWPAGPDPDPPRSPPSADRKQRVSRISQLDLLRDLRHKTLRRVRPAEQGGGTTRTADGLLSVWSLLPAAPLLAAVSHQVTIKQTWTTGVSEAERGGLWLDHQLWCHQYLGDGGHLFGDQSLELRCVQGRSVIGSFVKLCDQRVDGQLQLWVLQHKHSR